MTEANTHGLPRERPEVREVRTIEEMRACEAVQLDVWGFEQREIVPAAHLRAVVHAGGLVLGGFVDGRMAGFAYGFPARAQHPGESGIGLHSHMVGVRPAYQRSGVGRHLKWAQRAWCLEQGMPWITWTFDPIQAKNARLNFHHLGVRSYAYLVDFYGVLESALSGRQATDRLLALWDLRADAVARRAEAFAGADTEPPPDAAPLPGRTWDGAPGHGDVGSGEVSGAVVTAEASPGGAAASKAAPKAAQGATPERAAERWLVRRGRGGAPTSEPWIAPQQATGVLRVAVPDDATALLRQDPEAAQVWRTAVRRAIVGALEAGYHVGGFEDGAYVLRPTEPAAPAVSKADFKK